MPRPTVQPGQVLVRVRYSAVSVGTEIAGLKGARPAAADAAPLEQAKSYSALLGRYFVKAVHDPRKAARRLSNIARTQLSRAMPPNPQPAAPAERVQLDWVRGSATTYAASDKGLTLTTDDSDWGYQALARPVAVPDNHAIAIDLTGTIQKSAVSIGLLGEGEADWVANKTLREGLIDERFIFAAQGNKEVSLVISNAQGGPSELSFDTIAMSLVPPDGSGLPPSEMDQTGWHLGYSASGEVVEVGEGVTDLVPGDSVACAGVTRANHADFAVVPRNLVCRVPDGCSLQSAATTTIGTIAMQGVRRTAPALGERVCVIGLGLLGQMTCQMLHAAGSVVIGMDLDAQRVARARDGGMAHGTSDADELTRIVRDITGGHGADRTIVAAASSSRSVINLAMEVTRRKGTVVIVGDVALDIDRAAFYRKEIDLLMSTSYGPGRYDDRYEEEGIDYPYAYVRWTENRNMASYLELIASGRLDIDSLIDAVVPVDDAQDLYQALVEGSGTAPLGVLIEYSGEAPIYPEPLDSTKVTLRGHRKIKKDLINTVLVGAGGFGVSMLAPQIERLGDRYSLRGVVSRDQVRGGNFARDYRLDLFSSELQDVLQNPDIDLVVVATRHNEHADQVCQSLEAGKHVFVEKPLALSWSELEYIVSAYEALDMPPHLMVGFNRRFSPALQKLGEIIAGRNGPLMMNYRLNGGYIAADHWVQAEQGGGRNIGEACHMYDVFRSLAGSPVTGVEAVAIDPGPSSYLRNDNFTAVTRYRDGSTGTLIYTALGPKQGLPKERLEVFCDGEAYLLDDYKSLTRTSDGKVLWSNADPDKGHFEELRQFGDALKNGGETPIPFSEIVETTAVALEVEDLLFGRAPNPDSC